MTHKNAGSQFAVAGLIALMLCAAGAAHAQVYRSVGPDGRVTFSDQPPPASQAQTVNTPGASAGATGGQLPYELRQVVGRFPVTLYTGENCTPCNSARSHLSNRGIPFTEKTVTSKEDGEALTRLSGGATLPLVTVGGQQLKGYSDAELTQFLDAAGYPKASKLPAGYRNPPASPLVEVQRPAETAAPAGGEKAPRPARMRRTVPDAPVENTNPAGIRF